MGGFLQAVFWTAASYLAFNKTGNAIAVKAGKQLLTFCNDCEQLLIKKINNPTEEEDATLRSSTRTTGLLVQGDGSAGGDGESGVREGLSGGRVLADAPAEGDSVQRES